MLRICGVTKHYKESTALRNVSLTLDRGEIVGLFGANGAGKTTLLKATMGLLEQNSGWITLDDMLLQQTAYEKLSYITEEGSFFPDLTLNAHCKFFAGMLPLFNTDRFERLLKFFELEPNKKARTLSRGQRAKLEIAIGMSRGADFILMDEPFLGKDIFTRRDFLKLMIAMLDSHEGVMIATHQIEEIEMFITRAVVMRDGKIITDRQMDDLTTEWGSLSEFIQKSCGYDNDRIMEFI